MVKIKNPLLSLKSSGRLANLTFLRRRKTDIAEKTPVVPDQKTLAQLSWRHMYQKAVALWLALSAAEKQDWESQARPKHMTGFAWFMSQALKPNPGLYLPLQGGTMQGIINMDGYKISDLLDPVAVQDADTKAARDAAIAAALAGSLTCDIYGYDGSNWQKLLVESAAQHNLRTRLYAGSNALYATQWKNLSQDPGTEVGLATLSTVYLWQSDVRARILHDAYAVGDNTTGLYSLPCCLWGFDGAYWQRLRTWDTGVLKVGRAEIGLSTLRRTIAGQVKASAGKLYWMTMNPTAANSVVELTNDLDGSTAIVWDMTHGVNSSHHMNIDPPMEFSNGIYLKTATNITSVIFGFK